MIRKILWGLALLLMLAGCKRHTIIPDSELALIFHDAFLANSLYKGGDAKRDSLLVYEPIFARYGYTTEDVQYTIGNFSKRKSARLGDVVELAIDMLESEGKVLDKAVADLDTVRNIALRTSRRVVLTDSAVRVSRLKDTLKLRFAIDSARPGEYRMIARYEVDSLDENVGLRFQCWGERADSTIFSSQQIQLRRERVEELERTIRCEDSAKRVVFNFWYPKRGEKRKRPSVTLHEVNIYYTMTADEALDSLYEQDLNIRIFAHDFLRTIEQKDSLPLPADTARVAEESAR